MEIKQKRMSNHHTFTFNDESLNFAFECRRSIGIFAVISLCQFSNSWFVLRADNLWRDLLDSSVSRGNSLNDEFQLGNNIVGILDVVLMAY